MIDLQPRKVPRQHRSRATVTAILDAAACLLVRRGYETLTTNQISERAGVSIGTLYEYFPNREAIVAALAARAFETLVGVMRSALEAGEAEEALAGVEHILWAGVRFMIEQRCVFKVLAREAPFVFQVPAVLRARATLDGLSLGVGVRSGVRLRLPSPDIDAWLISRMLFGAMSDVAFLDQDEAHRALQMRELARLTFRMARARDPDDPPGRVALGVGVIAPPFTATGWMGQAAASAYYGGPPWD